MFSQNNTLSQSDTTRNYGIDALRMVAMLLVLTSHILGYGGILETAIPFSSQYETAWLLEIIAYCSVNCYALISGYVGITAKYRYHNILLLWIQVVYYTIGITLIFSILIPGSAPLSKWIKAALPVTGGYYWYFTAYFALFLFMPLLNVAINHLSQKQLSAVIWGLILAFSFLQTLFHREIFSTTSNAWLLMILYIIGGYIRKYGLFSKSCLLKLFFGFFSMVLFTWLIMFLIESEILFFLKPFGKNYLLEHTSPTILFASIFLILIFERLHISPFLQKTIAFFAPASFSVYLIHAHSFVWKYLLNQRFALYATFPVPLEIASILLTAVAIYFSCSFIDLIRIFIFNKTKIRQRLAKLEKKYLGNLWY